MALVDVLPDPDRLATFPLHPRHAAALLQGHARGCPRIIDALALLSGPGQGDLEEQALDRGARRIAGQLRRLARRLGPWRSQETEIGPSLLAGFPDRVALRRGDSDRYQLSDGQGARLHGSGPRLLLALQVTGGHGDHRIRRYVELCSVPTNSEAQVDWHDGRVRSSTVEIFGRVVFHRHPGPKPTNEQCRALVLQHCTAQDLGWHDELDRRVSLARQVDPSLPPLDRQACFERAAESAHSATSLEQWSGWLDNWTWAARQRLDALCPERVAVPSGSRLRIRYTAEGPVLAARVQQLFGWQHTPQIAGRSLRIELLSPANRPVQVTDDLAGFWAGSYAAVRKDMRGRYPKHAWPEDPTGAVAEDRPKRRR
jgi:ATP-dependent helicase HrpB